MRRKYPHFRSIDVSDINYYNNILVPFVNKSIFLPRCLFANVNLYVFLLFFLYVLVGDFDDSGDILFAVRVPDSFDVFFQSENGNGSRRNIRLETRRTTVVRGGVCEVAVVVVRGQVVVTTKLRVV